ncbi:MAG TPA: hypothetical protein VEM41_14085 [Actinomycetota bacterium]|nr:hypothetical protein [Actinomycetota bacterium]
MAGISERGTYGRAGIPRVWAFVVGGGLLVLAVADAVSGRHGLKVGGHTALMTAPTLDVVYALLGIAAIASAFISEVAVKVTLRTIGVVLVVLVGLGIAARASIGKALGFPTKIPMAINLLDLAAAVAVLVIAFSAARLSYAED